MSGALEGARPAYLAVLGPPRDGPQKQARRVRRPRRRTPERDGDSQDGPQMHEGRGPTGRTLQGDGNPLEGPKKHAGTETHGTDPRKQIRMGWRYTGRTSKEDGSPWDEPQKQTIMGRIYTGWIPKRDGDTDPRSKRRRRPTGRPPKGATVDEHMHLSILVAVRCGWGESSETNVV